MSIELLNTLSTISFIVAAFMLVAAGVTFFILKIPAVYGDLSGKTAQKTIEEIRQRNAAGKQAAYEPSKVNMERGRITTEIDTDATTVPDTNCAEATTILNREVAATTEILSASSEDVQVNLQPAKDGIFNIDNEIGFSESSEVIE